MRLHIIRHMVNTHSHHSILPVCSITFSAYERNNIYLYDEMDLETMKNFSDDTSDLWTKFVGILKDKDKTKALLIIVHETCCKMTSGEQQIERKNPLLS